MSKVLKTVSAGGNPGIDDGLARIRVFSTKGTLVVATSLSTMTEKCPDCYEAVRGDPAVSRLQIRARDM